MSYGLAQARYTSDATQTASPAKLLVMLYDRLLLDLSRGEEALAKGDLAGAGHQISHACDILLELYGTLDVGMWPQGEALAQLYLWLVQQLMQARLRKEPATVAKCRELVVPLRDAWAAAAEQTTTIDPAALQPEALVPAGEGAA